LIIMNSQLRHFVPFISMTYSTRLVRSISLHAVRIVPVLFCPNSSSRFLVSSSEKLASTKACSGSLSLSFSLSLSLARASRAHRSLQLNFFLLSRERRESATGCECTLSRRFASHEDRYRSDGNNASPATATVIYRTTDRIVAWPSRAFASSITRVGKATRKNGVGGKRNGRRVGIPLPRLFDPRALLVCRASILSGACSLFLSLSLSLFSLPSDRTAPCLRVFKSTTHPLYMCARQ